MLDIKYKQNKDSQFNPYEFNAGTSLAVIHNNSIILATDTRHSSEYTINTRESSRIFDMGHFFLIVTGFQADGYQIYISVQYELMDYKIKNNKDMPLSSVAHLVHNIQYSRRFFPLYSYPMLCGFENGKPRLYTYDPVGNYSESTCRVDGSGTVFIQPILDSMIDGKNNGTVVENLDEAVRLIKTAFISCAERDVRTGDFMEMVVLTEEKAERTIMSLRFD